MLNMYRVNTNKKCVDYRHYIDVYVNCHPNAVFLPRREIWISSKCMTTNKDVTKLAKYYSEILP